MAAAQVDDVLCTIEANRPPAGVPQPPGLRGQSAKCDRFATVLQPFFETQILSYSAPTAYVVHVIKRLHFTGPTERNRTLPNAFARIDLSGFHSAFRTLHSALKNPSKTHPFPHRKMGGRTSTKVAKRSQLLYRMRLYETETGPKSSSFPH